MLKVFLVEDEFIVREGIKNNINWREEGFIFCGEAADGEIAYNLIKAQQPDIIITDIKMPFMNGLELSRLIKNELPHSKVIILSGYGEFSFAQEAVNIGVTEYILKPVSSAKLIKAVKRVGQQIIDERKRKANFGEFGWGLEENEDYIKQRFFEEIIGGRMSTAKILKKGKELGIEMSAGHYQIMLFRYNIKNESEDYSNKLLELKTALNDLNSRYDRNIILFNRDIRGNVLLIKGETLKDLDNIRGRYIGEMKGIFSAYPDANYFAGFGKPVNRLTCILESYEGATLTFIRRFTINKSAIISSDELLEHIYEDDGPTITATQLGGLDLEGAEKFLRNGEANRIHCFIEELLESISETGQKSLLFTQYFLMNIHFTVITFLREIEKIEVLKKRPFMEIDEIKETLFDFEGVRDYLIEIFTIAIEQRDLLRTKPYYRIIEQAKKYIKENYANEDISLNEVAEHVNLSPSHFSTIFSRETGETFIRYLIELRMDRAKELLKCTDLLCSEISNKVGYKDPHYFSYLFKKENSCTPLQYRKAKI